MSRFPPAVDERAVDFLLEMRGVSSTLSQLVAEMRGMTVNHVLFSGTRTLDSSGTWSKSWTVPFAAVAIGNFGSATLTVVNEPRQSGPPSGGDGVRLLGPGDSAVFNMVGRSLTVYGNPGDRISLEVLDKPQGPGPSGGADDGGGSATATLTDVAANVASVALLAANPSRRGASIFNNGAGNLYVAYAAASSTALFTVKVGPGQLLDLGDDPIYKGVISGIWDAAGGDGAQITELS